MPEKPDNLYEAIAARGEGAAGAHPETPSSFVRDDPHEKTVCKRFATVFVSFLTPCDASSQFRAETEI